jgi:hypothetical protein
VSPWLECVRHECRHAWHQYRPAKPAIVVIHAVELKAVVLAAQAGTVEAQVAARRPRTVAFNVAARFARVISDALGNVSGKPAMVSELSLRALPSNDVHFDSSVGENRATRRR